MAYNGWTNYETWNYALWVGGDEGLYYLQQEWLKSLGHAPDGTEVRKFLIFAVGYVSPDGAELCAANCWEIADNWLDDWEAVHNDD